MTLIEIEALLLELPDDDFRLYELLSEYDEIYRAPDLSLITRRIRPSADPDLSSLAISLSAERSVGSKDYWASIFRFIDGVEWDPYGSLKLASVFALRFYNSDDFALSNAVYVAYTSDNANIREAVCVLAQYKVGIDPVYIVWSTKDGDLVEKIPQLAQEWLASRLKKVN
ncbi:hypothetical protein MMA231_04043 (plasmid) [Asticcacaulis sp. MM231]|uniref:hypothetical protein n=1 Tax=Asticcacaulis sp. MM231 TaxID=3157666 RepID=UPI0032D5ABD5